MEILQHRVEDAVLVASLRETLGRGATVAEQPLENNAWVVLRRQRSGWRAPGKRIQIRAAVAVLTLAGKKVEIDGELERRQRGFGAEHIGRELVGGDAVAH